MKFILSTLLLPLALAAAVPAKQATPGEVRKPSVDQLLNPPQENVIPGQFIVTLKPEESLQAVQEHVDWVGKVQKRNLQRRGLGSIPLIGRVVSKISKKQKSQGKSDGGIDKVWKANFKGYKGEFDRDTLKDILKSKDVLAVEPVVKLFPAVITQPKDAPKAPKSQPTWGLASLSYKGQPSSKYGFKTYSYDDKMGQGTWAYVIDSGVFTAHKEFQGRAFMGYNALSSQGIDDADTGGHGTHVSGTIASNTYGVAKRANIMGVKVFDGSNGAGLDIIIDAYEWAVKNITSTPGRASKSVISMSLGGSGFSTAFDLAITNAYKKGVLTVVAGGNAGVLASTYFPASTGVALTVGAIDKSYNKAGFSNWGPAIDIFAAGVTIRSCGIKNRSQSVWMSGTSMSTPMISGLALSLMAQKPSLNTPALVTAEILRLASKDAIKGDIGDGTPNLVAWNGFNQSGDEDE